MLKTKKKHPFNKKKSPKRKTKYRTISKLKECFKTFKPLDFNYNRNISFDKLKTFVKKSNLNSSDYSNHIHKVCAFLNETVNTTVTNNLTILQSEIDVSKLFETKNNCSKIMKLGKDKLNVNDKEIFCGMYENDFCSEIFVQELFYKLTEYFIERKTIFLYMDIYDYLLEYHEEEEIQERLVHSTCIIFHPSNSTSTHNNYKMFYFNSHGNVITKNCVYEKYITRKRKREINTDTSVDMFVMHSLMECYNKKSKKFISSYSSDKPFNIIYEPNHKHNYLGPNLQISDDEGFCYIFPFIICYEMIMNMNKKFVPFYKNSSKNSQNYTTYNKMLSQNDFQNFIMTIFSKYNSRIKDYYTQINYCCNFEKHNTRLEKILEFDRHKTFEKNYIQVILFLYQYNIVYWIGDSG